MALDNKYFSYCKEIGIMKENYTKESALASLKKAVTETYDADPAFIQKVSNLTLNSKEVSVRSCVLYQYNINLEYVVGGVIKHTTFHEFGQSGVHKSLHITEYKGDGAYTILKDASLVPYAIFNDKNLFTYDEMKNALTDLIEKKLPSNCTYFESKGWDISAYIVPVLVVIMEHKGEYYHLYFNLQNGYKHWEWPIDPKMLKNGKKAHRFAKFLRFLAITISLAGTVLGFLKSGLVNGLIGALISLIIITIIKKKSKGLVHYQNIYRKNRNRSKYSLVILEYVMLALAIVSLVLGLL